MITRRTTGLLLRSQRCCARSLLGRSLHIPAANPSWVDTSHAPAQFDPSSILVYPNVLTAEEESTILEELNVKFQRRRYEKGHWDAVIDRYKEIELLDEITDYSETLQQALQRIRAHLSSHHVGNVPFLPCHVIDLHQDGHLGAHVDSVRFSGQMVAGLSLASSAIMRFRPEKAGHNQYYIDAYLPRRSLYVMKGDLRYFYTHELLPTDSRFGTIVVPRERRISILFRDTKAEE